MTRSTRGAARISIVWMITVMVLFFASLGFAFVATSDLNRERGLKANAEVERDEKVALFAAEADVARAQTVAVGWFSESDADPRINTDAMTVSMEGFKDAFGITESSPKTVQDLLPLAITEHKRINDELVQKRNRITTLEGELKQARKTATDITRAKDSELSTIRQQLSDEADKFQRDQQDAAQRLAAAQQQASDFHAEKKQAVRDSEEAALVAEKKLAEVDARASILSRDLELPKQADTLDGAVLTVSSSLPLGWIDIGANDRLARGTVFDVLSGTIGNQRLKARCRVTRLKPSMAEVEFFDVASDFDPVIPGDALENKLFVPGGARNAVLAGRFSSPNEAELVALLDRIGIRVQKGLQLDTHYLIVGSAVFEDEDGEALDEPRQPYELDIYREAEAKHVSIISIADLRGYFVF